jgi:hypothetical protein
MKVFLLCVFAVFLSSCGKQETCQDEADCLNNPHCKCWCSQVCGYRKKQENDSPRYIQNDPNGKFCYCKQWDIDLYDENCINGEGVSQPPGAE